MALIEAPAFTRVLSTCLDEDGYRALQQALADQPELGDVIEGTGGFRKMRDGPTLGEERAGGAASGSSTTFSSPSSRSG